MEGAIMDLSALALSKQYTNKVAAGITAARVEGSTIILTLIDGSEARCNLPTPENGKDGIDGQNGKDGISVIDLSIDIDGSLLCHMSDGSVIDAGYVPTVDPDLTNYYTKEEIDDKNNVKMTGYFWDTSSNSLTLGSNLEKISSSRYAGIFQELSNLWDQIAIHGMHPIEVKDKNNYRAWLMPNGTAGGSFYMVYKFRGQSIENNPTSATDVDLYKFFYLEFRVNRDDNTLWEADFLCKKGYEQPSMAQVESYVQGQIENIDIPETDLTNYYTKEEVDEAIENIDIPEIDLSNYYNKNEIGDITSLVDWKANDTVVNYFNRHPGIYDMTITSSLDDPAVEFTVPTNERERILQMVKKHKDKCFWLNIHTPIQSNGSHTLIPLHLSRFQSGETWKQIIPAFHFCNGTLRIRRVECETWSPVNSDSSDRPTSLKMKFLSETTDNTIATKNDITTAISNISIPDMTNYYTKEEVNNTVSNIPRPKTHDGEGMIGWYGTAVSGENLTEAYGVTPDMIRAVNAGDFISWPSRVRTGAIENTICLYQMSYEVYNKDEMTNLETIDIKIGKSPDVTYTYVIVGDSVYKESY